MYELKKDLLVFNVDFNERDREEGRHVVASLRFVLNPRVPDQGECVWMEDDEGNGCPGFVQAVRQRTVLIEPCWEHWIAPLRERVEFMPSFTGAEQMFVGVGAQR
ncbi:MAG: hypothetical protein ABSG64_12395 [Solirubrobacteraceae bacterium]|jgi:hypothetical protein